MKPYWSSRSLMKLDLGRVLLLLAAFYAADLIASVFSLAWAIPRPLPSNWIFLVSLAALHFLASLSCTFGMRDRSSAVLSAILSAALSYVLFCVVSVDVEMLLRSATPLAALELSALAGAMLSRPRAATKFSALPPPPQSSA